MSFRKILIINPFGIGDVLFTTPLISHLHLAYPEALIGYIANRRALPVIESNPKINKVYIYERDEFKDDLVQSWGRLLSQIKQEQFDVVFDFTLNASFGFFSMICGIKKRIGYDYRGRGRFLTDKLPLVGYEGRHVVEYYLDLMKLLDCREGFQTLPDRAGYKPAPTLEIFIDQTHQQWAKDWLKAQKVDATKPIIAVIPGGGASWGKDAASKRWPVSQYAALVDKIVAKSSSTIILMGDPKEQLLCQELTRQCSSSVYSAVGATTILQMTALLQECRMAIVNDGGPLHVAVAAGVLTVSMFGPVDPVVYGPYPLSEHIVIQKNLACQPCYRQFRKASCNHLSCLRDLTVEEVFGRLNL
ncbi:MAG: lipopolysaccharide heptosyltransferase II [Candidatus Omnitrophica bacterium]|nr:lipopolysaccharide heptosyltransferase II [Candidatus Omnitrophota bacterium]